MNIYIAKDYEDKPIAVLLADDPAKAAVAFVAMNIQMHSCEELDPNEDLGSHGVCFLLTSKKFNTNDLPTRRIEGHDFRKWKRGL